MDALAVIEKYYSKQSPLFQILVRHSRIVTEKSLDIARANAHLNPDIEFIRRAAMLHDIGIFQTRAKSIGCSGDNPYICHGYLGRILLDREGLPPAYGLVCERHTGAGITKENILDNHLPLPPRDMVPVSLEEKIICVADKYHSKTADPGSQGPTTSQVIKSLGSIDPGHARRFSDWAEAFGL